MPRPIIAPDDALLLDIPTVCRRLGLPRTKVYAEIAAGRLCPTVRVGRSRRVPASTLVRYVDLLIAEQGDQPPAA